MGIRKSLKVILGEDNPKEYSHEDLIQSLKNNDEFTKYRTKKEIDKFKSKTLGEIKYNKVNYNPKEECYLENLIQIYRNLPFEYKLILYGEAKGMLNCLK